MRIAVTGGRYYADASIVELALERFDARDELAHGACSGADSIAAEYARRRGWKVTEFRANWRPNGSLDRSAGPRRNRRLLDEFKPELLIAFPGGRGTTNMIKLAKKAGIPVFHGTKLVREDFNREIERLKDPK